ncbi:hypothetical protein ACEYW6_33320 [Nostoc sp. UIC 10607]|uniref:hypothetical protein n=1 Tax=Nostoc sp. UIC 10607 TaxID=3045935 RepID=UPI0039A187EB
MSYESTKRNRYFEPPPAGNDFPDTNRHHWQDFNDYHAPNARMHHANLHDWGIARGLGATGTIGSPSITIEPGVAIDKQGRLFALATNGRGDVRINQSDNEVQSNVPVQLNIDSRFSSQTLYLTIQFSERLRAEGGTAGGRFEQVPWIRLQPVTGIGAYEDNGTSIILAIIVVDATGKLAELKEKDPNLSFRRRLIGEEIGELRFRRAIKDDGGVEETIDTVLLPVDGSGLQANILGQPALQLFAREQKNTYLTLINPNGQHAIQLDTTSGAGSILIKNAEDKGIGAFQSSDEGAGLLRLYNKTGERATIELFANGGESGIVMLFGTDGNEKVRLHESGITTEGYISSSSIFADQFGSVNTSGWITKTFSNNTPAVQTALLQGEAAGWLGLFNSSGQRNATLIGDGRLILGGEGTIGSLVSNFADSKAAVQIDRLQGDTAGWLGLFDSSGNRNTTLIGDGRIICKQLFADQFGFVSIRNSAGKEVVYIGTTVNNDGNILVNDSAGNQKLYLQGNGAKNFVMAHPHDENKNIIYACIEGPEAAAYIRGKSRLVNGQAEIEFPEHFTLVVNSETITIQLTPRSADSKGLAVVAQSERGFTVRELWQGEGNYEFDYFVAGVRQGMEHFTPVVDKGWTAFGEPMGMSVSGSPAAPQAASMVQETSPSTSAQPIEPVSSPAPQSVILQNAIPEPPILRFSSIPSPSAINFEDKKP